MKSKFKLLGGLIDFGVVIGCCKRDLHYAVGCYESIRCFMPDAPICFLYDGELPPELLCGLHNVDFLTRSNTNAEVLRRRSFGPGFTKMVSFFESPFEKYLYLDADTVVCGDLRRVPDWERFDIIADRYGSYNDEAICKWFFDPRKIEDLVPEFDYRSHRDDYFCTGTFFARKGSLSMERYLELLDMADQNPSAFKFWEMGLLNLMIFDAQDKRTARVDGVSYQLVVSDHAKEALCRRFESAIADPNAAESPAVFHFPNPKHFVGQSSVYSVPMTFFRRRFYRQTRKFGWIRTELTLLAEDFKFIHYPWLRIFVRLKISTLLSALGLRRRSSCA